jgi:hypothetical protein
MGAVFSGRLEITKQGVSKHTQEKKIWQTFISGCMLDYIA